MFLSLPAAWFMQKRLEREIPELYAECELPAGVQQGVIARQGLVYTYVATLVSPHTQTNRAEIILRYSNAQNVAVLVPFRSRRWILWNAGDFAAWEQHREDEMEWEMLREFLSWFLHLMSLSSFMKSSSEILS